MIYDLDPYYPSAYGTHRTRQFYEIHPDADAFYKDWQASGLPQQDLTEEDIRLIYTLLQSRYRNNSIKSSDEHRYTAELMSITWEHGPTYLKQVDLQRKLRSMSEEEYMSGAEAIHNHALNPSSPPATNAYDALSKIDEQTATGYRRAKTDAILMLSGMLNSDYTDQFLSRYRKLFDVFATAGEPLWYGNEEDQDG